MVKYALMSSLKTAVLLIGFGGPTKPEEVRPFLESVLRGIRIPEERFNEVLHHYEVVGNRSPYNEITERQKKALEIELKKRGVDFPVFVGLRHSTPSFKDAVLQIGHLGVEQVIGFVLANFRCYSSFEKYVERLNEAEAEAGQKLPIIYTKSFFKHRLFIKAQSRKVEELLKNFSDKDKKETLFIFSAHSVPVEMSKKSDYSGQFESCSREVAQNLSLQNWTTGYQSRSGSPRDPWLEPAAEKIVKEADTKQFKNIVLIPIGFLCDNVEVLFDLDIELKQIAEEKGFKYFRASTVTDEPFFIQMMADLILEETRSFVR